MATTHEINAVAQVFELPAHYEFHVQSLTSDPQTGAPQDFEFSLVSEEQFERGSGGGQFLYTPSFQGSVLGTTDTESALLLRSGQPIRITMQKKNLRTGSQYVYIGLAIVAVITASIILGRWFYRRQRTTSSAPHDVPEVSVDPPPASIEVPLLTEQGASILDKLKKLRT